MAPSFGEKKVCCVVTCDDDRKLLRAIEDLATVFAPSRRRAREENIIVGFQYDNIFVE